MALVTGLAVALAVIAVALSAYEGTRSQLQGQLDQSLQSLTGSILAPVGLSAHGQPIGGHHGPTRGRRPASVGSGFGFSGTPQRNSDGDNDEGLGLDQRHGPPFGGATGAVTVVHANGTIYPSPGQRPRIPIDSRARALAKSGHGQYYEDMEVAGTRIRILVTGIRARGALVVALPLKDVDQRARQRAAAAGADFRRGGPAGRGGGHAGRPHGAGADRAVHESDRGDRRAA